MKIPRFRIYREDTKEHYTVTDINFVTGWLMAKLSGSVIGINLNDKKYELELMSPIKSKRGYDIYENDIVRYRQDRVQIVWCEETGGLQGRYLARHRMYGRMNDICLRKLDGQCELLGPLILGH